MKKKRTATLIAICVLLAAFVHPSSPFQSDELLVDDEEFEGVKLPGSEIPDPIHSPPRVRRRAEGDSGPADTKVQFALEHRLGTVGEFLPAGLLTARLKTSSHGGQTLTKLRISRNALTEREQTLFLELLEKDDFYQIRVPANVLNPGKDYVLSSVKAEGVNVLAVNYGSPSSCPYPRLLRKPSKWFFNSHTVLKNGELAPRKPSFAEAALKVENGEDEGIKPPERSLLSKYWMYLIPLGLIVMNAITQAMNMPEEQAAGAAGQSSSQQQAVPTQRAANPGVRRR